MSRHACQPCSRPLSSRTCACLPVGPRVLQESLSRRRAAWCGLPCGMPHGRKLHTSAVQTYLQPSAVR
jgi:hypothetical protein